MKNVRSIRVAAAFVSTALLAPITPIATAADAYVPVMDNTFVGVGSDATKTNLNWLTDKTLKRQVVQVAKASDVVDGQFPANAPVVEAKVASSSVDGVGFGVSRYQAKAAIDTPEANTDYTFRVSTDQKNWTPARTFNTGGFNDENWNFASFGDPQLGASDDLEADKVGWNNTVKTVQDKLPGTDFYLSLGDQVNSVLKASDQMSEMGAFFSPEGLSKRRLAVNRGNHDSMTSLYGQSFNLPNSTASNPLSDTFNYAYTYNNALIVTLDTEAPFNYLTNKYDEAGFQKQVDFLHQQIANKPTNVDWVIVTYHRSSWSQAYHQADARIQDWRKHMLPEISKANVDLVLGGHDHIYTRSQLLEGNEPVQVPEQRSNDVTLTPKAGQTLYLAQTSSSASKFYDFSANPVILNPEDYLIDYPLPIHRYDRPDITNIQQSDAEGITARQTGYWAQTRTAQYTDVQIHGGKEIVLTTYDTGRTADGTILPERAGQVVDKVALKSKNA